MKRRDFTKVCLSCVAGALLPPALSGCHGVHYITGAREPDGISVSKSEFIYFRKDKQLLRNYLVVRNEGLKFPIYVYRFSDAEYSALWMECTHQGAELNASGDHLHCPSHGSEFDNRGIVQEGPAEKNLRSFKVHDRNDTILIDLRT